MRTLIWKELRENARWLPVGLILVALVAWMVAPRSFQPQSQITLGLLDYLAVLLPALALGLGILQSVRDLQPAPGAYLRHRGVTSNQIFLSKLAAGFSIYAAAVALPLLVMAAWIAMQGMHWTPMRPAQVIPPLVYALAAFLMHPAAMLMMARGASWWGTKWFPLLPVAATVFFFAVVLRARTVIGSAPSALLIVLALLGLAWIACRGWRLLDDDPPASWRDQSAARWLVPSYLAMSALVTTAGALTLSIIFVESLVRSAADATVMAHNQIVIDTDTGDPWLLTYQQEQNENHEWEVNRLSGDRIERGRRINPLKRQDLPPRVKHLADLRSLTTFHSISDGFFQPQRVGVSASELYWVFDYRGYLLGYQGLPRRWGQTVAADGVHPAGQLMGRPFSVDPISTGSTAFSHFRDAGYQGLLLDASGVYILHERPLAIRQIIQGPISAATSSISEDVQAPRLILRSQGKLSEYRLVDSQGSEQWFDKPAGDAPVVRNRSLGGFELAAELVQSVDLPAAVAAAEILSVRARNDGFMLAEGANSGVYPPERLFQISADGSYRTITYSILPGTLSRPAVDAAGVRWMGLFPPVFLLVIAGGTIWASGDSSFQVARAIEHLPGPFVTFCVVTGIVLLISGIWVVVAARRRDLPRGQRRLWYAGVLLLGLATPLAILAIHQRVYWEPCPRCDKRRRIDRDRCAHCGAPWEPPPSEGIEISDAREHAPRANVTAPA